VGEKPHRGQGAIAKSVLELVGSAQGLKQLTKTKARSSHVTLDRESLDCLRILPSGVFGDAGHLRPGEGFKGCAIRALGWREKGAYGATRFVLARPLLAAIIVAAVAAAMGPVILRLRGHYFAIGSISLVEIGSVLASNWSSLTGGGEGLNVRFLPGGPDFIARFFLYAMLAILVAALATTLLVDRGRLGFGLRCIAQNEDAAEMVGVPSTRYKIAAFVLSGVFCGAAGAAYASWVGYIAPADAFSILLTVKVPVMVLLGGAGSVLGPLIGSAALVLLEETVWARFLDYHQAILGAIIVALIFFLPGGLLGLRLRWRS
jgi:ABC-type branched-subunit amino acid transport system permease subunit